MKSIQVWLRLNRAQWPVNLLLMAMLATLSPQCLTAHGIGTPQLVNAPVGPYAIWAYTDPNPLRVGEMHVTVGAAERKTMTMLDNVAIQVTIQPLDHNSSASTATATNTDTINRLLYTAVLAPTTAGQWRATIKLEGKLGVGSIAFTTPVLPRPFITWGGIVRISLGVVAAGWFFWTWRRWQPPARRSSATGTLFTDKSQSITWLP